MAAQIKAAAGQPPTIKGLPFLGNALSLRIDPLRYFVNLYKQHGPVFKISLIGRPYTIMAGIEANRFLAKEGNAVLGSENLFGSFASELGANAFLPAMDGASHIHLRKTLRQAYSRETINSQLKDVVDITAAYATTWSAGTSLPLFPTLQRIVTDHLGQLIGGRTCGEYFDDLWLLLNANMKVHVLKTHPKWILKLPNYRRARVRSYEFARDVLDWHRANPPVDRPRNLADDLLSAINEHGEPYSENEMLSALMGAYFAGMDTVAATASFMLYAILKDTSLLTRLQTEVDAAFENGGLTPEALRRMPVLHNTAMETLRMYTIAAFTPRSVVEAFDFEGYHFDVGTEVMVINALTHFLPEFYVNPDTFDIDRFDHPDYKKVPQAFAPYTLGSHTCLGAGMAETQLMTLIATLIRTLDLELDPPGADVTIFANPIPNPGRKFAIRVVGQRKPALIEQAAESVR